MKRTPDLDVKNPAWRDTVLAIIARKSTHGVPQPAGLPDDGYYRLRLLKGRWRVSYVVNRRQEVTLGTVDAGYCDQARKDWFGNKPKITLTLESGRRVMVFFDHGNPDLPRPVPVEVAARMAAA